MEEQPDGWREDVELTAAELLAACTEGGAGGTLLLMRGPARSASLFAEELRAAARHVARQFKRRELSKQYLAALLG